MIEKIRKAPAHNKASEADYLLQGKLFCGMCGAPMVGESGRSKTGKVYHYYTCAARKKSHTCQKRNEKKDFIEWYVVEQVVEYVLTPERIQMISQRVVDEYYKSFNASGVKALEQQITKLDHELDKLVDTLVKTSAKAALDKLNQKIDLLSLQKDEAELDLAKLKVASRIEITAEEIENWLQQFCHGDLFDMDFRRRIIDVFINAIYLYDDKVVIYFNIKDGKQISYIEMLDNMEGLESSDITSFLGSAVF